MTRRPNPSRRDGPIRDGGWADPTFLEHVVRWSGDSTDSGPAALGRSGGLGRAGILVLSSLTPQELPRGGIPVLGQGESLRRLCGRRVAGGLRAAGVAPTSTETVTLLLLAVLLAAAFGVLDEAVQTLTPGRSGGDAGDWLADVLRRYRRRVADPADIAPASALAPEKLTSTSAQSSSMRPSAATGSLPISASSHPGPVRTTAYTAPRTRPCPARHRGVPSLYSSGLEPGGTG